jgi:hypothetical protein
MLAMVVLPGPVSKAKPVFLTLNSHFFSHITLHQFTLQIKLTLLKLKAASGCLFWNGTPQWVTNKVTEWQLRNTQSWIHKWLN